MAGQYDRVRRLVRAAGESERFTIHALSRSRHDPERFPGIADCFARELESAEAQIARLQGFLGVDAFQLDTALPAVPDQADAGHGSVADMIDQLAAVYASQRLQLVLYRTLLAAAEEIGDNELGNLCKEALWVKDAQAARLAVEIANLDISRLPASQPAPAHEAEAEPAIAENHRSDAEAHHSGVEIHHDGHGHAEVSIQVEVGPGHAQSAHAVYAQAWSALAEAMAETRHRDDPAKPAVVARTRRAGNESRAW
jgi:ferritin-like metal-binding protein YciE